MNYHKDVAAACRIMAGDGHDHFLKFPICRQPRQGWTPALMLIDINDDNREMAVELLCKGMPRVPEYKWRINLDRITAYGANAKAGISPGQLLIVDNKCEGVMLTLADTRCEPEALPRTTVNLSSWYITPEQRWRAPLMMRRAMRLPAALITDLTPTPSVQKMLVALGFHRLNAGESLVVLPYAAATGHWRTRVFDVSKEADAIADAQSRDLIEKHLAFGCIGAVLETKKGAFPLIFKPRNVRGIPVARLIYCENNSELIENIGSVARFLLAKRQFLLNLDTPLDARIPGLKRRASGMKFASKPLPADRTDYAGSELGLFVF